MSKKNKDVHAAADSAHDAHRPNVKLYVLVFGALMVLTGLTVVVSKFHLPRPQAIALGLLIACAKASLVGAIFMHLWGENKLVHKFIYVTAFFGAFLILPMIDFVLLAPKMAHRNDVAAQRPDEGRTESVTETAKLTPPPAEAPKPAKAKGGKK